MSSQQKDNDLVAAVREGVEALHQRRPLRVSRVTIKMPPSYTAKQIARVRRKKMNVSQSVFAGYIGVSASTVRAWEQNQRSPSASARRLIQVAEKRPEILRELASSKT